MEIPETDGTASGLSDLNGLELNMAYRNLSALQEIQGPSAEEVERRKLLIEKDEAELKTEDTNAENH